MAVHYSNGIGKLYDKEIERPIAEVRYQLIETDPTKYTPKKWWGEFSTNRDIKHRGDSVYILELEDSRKGECFVNINTQERKRSASHHHYRFNGRGKLGRHLSIGSQGL